MMNHPLVKKALPHFIAVVLFLAIALLYCKPAVFDNKVLQQSDIAAFNGAIQNSVEYSKKHNGKYPLWTNNLFSGMPTVQIGGVGGSFVIGYTYKFLTLGMNGPSQFFFLACICFYILCCCLKINTWVAVATSLGYAYATYNPVIISVGHATKMLAIAYMPAVLGSLYLIFNKKYWLGGVLMALFTGLLVGVNHLQIAYYFFIAVGIMAIFYIIYCIQQKEIKHLLISGAIGIAAVVIGIAANAELLMSTYEYQKETIRGGAKALEKNTNEDIRKDGLNRDYAFSYSMFKSEPLVLLVPRMFGGSSDNEEVAIDKSKAFEVLGSFPKELRDQLPSPSFYWGGLIDPISVGTSGPPYAGAIIVFLAILGMFVVEAKHKWWMLTAIIVTCMLSWGSYFPSFNNFMFNNFPFYNKFRAPSMIMVIPQLMLTTLAALALNKVIHTTDKAIYLKTFYKSLIALAGVFVFLFICYFQFDFISANDKILTDQVRKMGNPEISSYIKDYTNALVDDRKGLMLGDIFRSLGFILLAILAIWAFLKNWIKPLVAVSIIGIVAFMDVVMVNKTYLNESKYKDKQEDTAVFEPNQKDLQILADKTDFRVFNNSGNAFSENYTSYHFKSIGGYHAAKLGIYQDLIERQLGKAQPNVAVLNMLNTKYIIQKGRLSEGGPVVTANVQQNPGALGSAWFVKNINFVKDAEAEMKALDSFDAKQTAFVQEQFKSSISIPLDYDTSAAIKLIKNDNDYIEYQSTSNKNAFAVFSEVYYKAGWKAYVDGKEQTIIKTNYALRGLALAAGTHKIEFKFLPEGTLMGKKYGSIITILLGLMLLSLIGYIYLNNKTTKERL
jgi:Co/Zn/Cd efflux system component